MDGLGISRDEVEIVGSWIVVNDRVAEDEVCRRIHSLIHSELSHVATTKDGWEKLYRDPGDGRFWELTFPQSEMHGGGPPALILIEPEKAREKYGASAGQ